MKSYYLIGIIGLLLYTGHTTMLITLHISMGMGRLCIQVTLAILMAGKHYFMKA